MSLPASASSTMAARCATTSWTCQPGHEGTGVARASPSSSATSAVRRSRVSRYSRARSRAGASSTVEPYFLPVLCARASVRGPRTAHDVSGWPPSIPSARCSRPWKFACSWDSTVRFGDDLALHRGGQPGQARRARLCGLLGRRLDRCGQQQAAHRGHQGEDDDADQYVAATAQAALTRTLATRTLATRTLATRTLATRTLATRTLATRALAGSDGHATTLLTHRAALSAPRRRLTVRPPPPDHGKHGTQATPDGPVEFPLVVQAQPVSR